MAIGISLPDNNLYNLLADRTIERLERGTYTRNRIPGKGSISVPVFTHQYLTRYRDNYVACGGFSISDITTQTKYLSQWPYTYGEIAREYLTYCEEQSGINLKPQRSFSMGHAPIYFTGPSKGLYAYVDITSCYFSLYKPLTLDCKFHGSSIAQGQIPFIRTAELNQNKAIRNTVFGIMAKRYMLVAQHKYLTPRDNHSTLFRPAIGAYVYQTTQAVAKESISNFDIHMWLTDAAILPYKEAEQFQQFLRTEWLLDSKIEAWGSSSILATAVYKVGEKMSKDFTRSVPQKRGKCNTLMQGIDIPSLKKSRQWLMSQYELDQTNWPFLSPGELPLVKQPGSL